MYVPKLNQTTDRGEMVKFMQRFGFATIVTVNDRLPVATHLPFLVTIENDEVVLTSHFAKANGQWADIENDNVLVIFSEPHAYISPSHYDSEINVPTWNYMAVHAYGRGKIVSEPNDVFKILEKTITNFESAYLPQWEKLPSDYKSAMIKGIVAFEITVTDLQGKKKLSQNKTEAERHRIIEALSNSASSNERLIADYMKDDQVED